MCKREFCEQIIALVAKITDLTVADIMSHARRPEIVDARYLAVCADADVSAFEDAIFRPRIKEGEWHCNKGNPPYKDMPMAVVEVPEKLYYLARYCHESNVWCDLNTGEIIENVVSYYPVKC